MWMPPYVEVIQNKHGAKYVSYTKSREIKWWTEIPRYEVWCAQHLHGITILSYCSQHSVPIYKCKDDNANKEMVIHSEPTILYGMVIGESATNNTSCIQYIIEILDGIQNKYEAEHLYETGTLDGLVKTQLSYNNTATGLYDEIGTFNDGFDKGNSSSFDRSVYLSLYNAKKFIKSPKTAGNILIKNQRFSLFTFT